MLKRLLFALFLLAPAFAFAQATPAPAKPAAPKAAAKPAAKAPAKPADKTADAASTSNKVLLKTSLGDITLEVYPDKAPKSVENFLGYVKSGFYDGTVFHRVIEGFMIQGGGFTKDLHQKSTKAPIAIESKNGLSNMRGTLAMARTGDPNSATAQFFINVKDNDFLNQAQARDGNGYTVFGKVVQGMDVVDKIRATPTGAGDVPLQQVVIKKATVEK
jgi:cyclophilin family peptidyl-prolyl cis-trans isomerase